MSFELFDTVRLAEPMPDLLLTTESVGVIVEVYTRPKLAYEVEFSDENSQTIIWLSFEPQQLQPA